MFSAHSPHSPLSSMCDFISSRTSISFKHKFSGKSSTHQIFKYSFMFTLSFPSKCRNCRQLVIGIARIHRFAYQIKRLSLVFLKQAVNIRPDLFFRGEKRFSKWEKLSSSLTNSSRLIDIRLVFDIVTGSMCVEKINEKDFWGEISLKLE